MKKTAEREKTLELAKSAGTEATVTENLMDAPTPMPALKIIKQFVLS